MPKKGYKQTTEHKRKSEETIRKMRMFTKEQEQQICGDYFSEEKPSTYILGNEWNCTSETISNIIKRNGYKLRTRSEARENKIHSNKTKKKIKKSIILQRQNHPGPFKDAKPELKMKEILNELNIPFKHQFRLKNHLFDFHILNSNILIEVDGDYWHGNPKKFQRLNKTQLYQRQRDIKNERLAKNSNFILLRFWEDDILRKDENVKNIINKLVRI